MISLYFLVSKVTKFDKVVKREICQITTKGTRVYTPLDVEASTPNSNYLLSLVEKTKSRANSVFGVCFIDTSIGDFYLGQFEDDCYNSRLLTLFAHYPPVHVSVFFLALNNDRITFSSYRKYFYY